MILVRMVLFLLQRAFKHCLKLLIVYCRILSIIFETETYFNNLNNFRNNGIGENAAIEIARNLSNLPKNLTYLNMNFP